MVGVGLASFATGAAIAQTDESHNADRAAGGIAKDSPLTKYPKPPFTEQNQPWPGLAGKMSPRPDHGESSYRGFWASQRS